VVGVDVDVELQRVVPRILDDAFGLVGAGVGVGFAFRLAVTVDAYLVSVLPAEKLVGWHIENLPCDVVQCQLDAGDGLDVLARDGALAGHLLDHVFVQPVDIEGVFAGDERPEAVDYLGDRPAPVRLAVPDDASVCGHPCEGPQVVSVDADRLDVCDTHVAVTPASSQNHRFPRGVSYRVLCVRVS
jgi:hypothetical protein